MGRDDRTSVMVTMATGAAAILASQFWGEGRGSRGEVVGLRPGLDTAQLDRYLEEAIDSFRRNQLPPDGPLYGGGKLIGIHSRGYPRHVDFLPTTAIVSLFRSAVTGSGQTFAQRQKMIKVQLPAALQTLNGINNDTIAYQYGAGVEQCEAIAQATSQYEHHWIYGMSGIIEREVADHPGSRFVIQMAANFNQGRKIMKAMRLTSFKKTEKLLQDLAQLPDWPDFGAEIVIEHYDDHPHINEPKPLNLFYVNLKGRTVKFGE